MDEILLDEQLRTQLSLQDQPVPITQAQQQQNRKRKVKKASQQNATKPSGEPVDVSESLKNEIEYMPNTMKTPISILQELLSRRGKFSLPNFFFHFIDFNIRTVDMKIFSNLAKKM
jgi:hypothetical protein